MTFWRDASSDSPPALPPIMKFCHLVLIFCLGIWSEITPGAETGRVLAAKSWRLGQVGQWEWEAYRDRPVDAGRFEIRFDGGKNAAEQTLRIWQRDVKLGWPVSLNGRKLGVLVTAETAMETLFAVPPGLLRDGENVLSVEPPSALDDVEVGPVTLMGLPVSDYLHQTSLAITVTDAASGKDLPCRITVTRSMDGALQPLSAGPEGEVAVRSVGEKASPLPWLSSGASVMILMPDCRWVASVRRSPKYVTVDVMFTTLFVVVFSPLPLQPALPKLRSGPGVCVPCVRVLRLQFYRRP